ncbi:hypothetical protein [Sphingomonas psychrotolerans]|uniref:Transposase n=1 Tax=Sphingomonas psychrotolerans TaxID=1327635 RepID=A0A2K8MFZ5_9SPHN|nr:hypothetical protein [Sphingomonas psychrotolerans]ATY32810.1 hypothetical protein CVN68_13195 [Sphingomonas psychrotolerans]
MMGERTLAQGALFFSFSLERHVPADHLLHSIERFGQTPSSFAASASANSTSISLSGSAMPQIADMIRMLTLRT